MSPHREFSVFLLLWPWILDLSHQNLVSSFLSQLYFHENLVRIQPLVQKILCRQESVKQHHCQRQSDLHLPLRWGRHNNFSSYEMQIYPDCNSCCTHTTLMNIWQPGQEILHTRNCPEEANFVLLLHVPWKWVNWLFDNNIIALDKALFFNQKVSIFFLFLNKNVCSEYSLD